MATLGVLRSVSHPVPARTVTALLFRTGQARQPSTATVSGPCLRQPKRFGSEECEDSISPAGTPTGCAPFHRGPCAMCPEGRGGAGAPPRVRDDVVMQAVKGGGTRAIERATEAFSILGERLHQRAGTMSGGQQQVADSRRICGRSQPLVDEASLGLAPTVVDEIFHVLRATNTRRCISADRRSVRPSGAADGLDRLRAHRGSIAFEGAAGDLLNSNLFEQYLGQGTA